MDIKKLKDFIQNLPDDMLVVLPCRGDYTKATLDVVEVIVSKHGIYDPEMDSRPQEVKTEVLLIE
jgi:hypothetical protein